MRYERKIALPAYKIVCAVFFIVMLSLARGVTYTFEAGIALEAPMAILSVCICADTYTQEIVSRRSEIQRLYPMKRRMHAIYKRIVIQEIFLLFIAVAGYGLFFLFQNPVTLAEGQNAAGNEGYQFLIYFVSIVITIGFWGLVSNLISCAFRNMWAGIGGCLTLWLLTNSSVGDRYLGEWNLFSYTFRAMENSGDFGWMCGKAVCIGIGMTTVAILPGVIGKRG